MPHPANENLSPSKAGLDLIKHFEGWSAQSYRDPVGIWTIGYGTIGEEATPGRKITRKEGEVFLRRELDSDIKTIKKLINVPVNQNQFDAIVSFVYNVGSGNFSKSTLRKLLNQKNYAGAAAQFARFNRARDRTTNEWMTLPGLTRRRTAEAALFTKPYEVEAAPAGPKVKPPAGPKVKPPTVKPVDIDTNIVPDEPVAHENALMEIIQKSDTVKLAITSIAALGATVTQMLDPLLDNPITAVAVVVAIVSTSALIYIKWRDTREFR